MNNQTNKNPEDYDDNLDGRPILHRWSIRYDRPYRRADKNTDTHDWDQLQG